MTPSIRSLRLEPRTLHSNPSPRDSDPQQNYRKTCNGGGRSVERSRKHQGEEREVPGQRKLPTTSSHLPASLLILLTTWPDPIPRSWLQGEATRTGQGCPPANHGALGGCPAEGRTQVRGNRSKGAVGAWRDHTDPPGGPG